ncbi:putative bifunctional diguanylate cyclase/phosphodiesterase [Aquincola tertiaricarbonis]|uniref:putative bifunctional diguanylate cyclase/phosphodiesterase n=1 Tax=Aquincola tertiaricarbonis TaxID=391953 RepID=UPI00061520E8|nr:bifunctional diguanylate cyclase/phosphodiesterase [Aquincola tertiaricarbonis]
MSEAAPTAYEALIQFLYQVPIGLVQTSLDGEITMINPMAAQLLMPLVPDGNLSNLFDVLHAVAPQLRGWSGGGAPEVPPGGVICESLRLTLPAVQQGAPQTLALRLLRLDAGTLMASLSDVSYMVLQEQQRLAKQLRDVTRIDSLTAMPNRMVALERIQGALAAAAADAQRQFAVLFINCDRFERINLTLGTAAGDELLRMVAARINGTVRLGDAVARATGPVQTAARLGGDEFVVVLEGLRIADDARIVAQRLTEVLCKPYTVGDRPVHLTASMGVVVCPETAASADSVLQDASLAMREAKRAHGARYCVFEPLMKEQAWRRGSIEGELRRALTEGQLFVVYQPIVDLRSGRPVGAEALVRWRHPERGIVPPIEFIEIAEETGLIGRLGEFVLRESCRQFMAWADELGECAPLLLSVNLSRAQLFEGGIAEQVATALRVSGLPPDQLQLEVTESLAAQDDRIQARLHELKALGLSLALDDFGTGYSSLASLHQLPVDVVKIDRSFVSQAESSAHHRVLIEATLRVAASLGMRTVAEGIETAGQAGILQALQCDKGQGYFYARPMPSDEAARWFCARAPQPCLA